MSGEDTYRIAESRVFRTHDIENVHERFGYQGGWVISNVIMLANAPGQIQGRVEFLVVASRRVYPYEGDSAFSWNGCNDDIRWTRTLQKPPSGDD